MTYRTTCPHCASIFRLGADQLDAAQGWVQCGVCGTAFDAHPALRLEDGSPLPAPEPPSLDTPAPDAVVDDVPATPAPDTTIDETAASDADVETRESADTHDAFAADGADETAAAASHEAPAPQGIAQREAAPELPSIILIDPDAEPADDDPGPLPHIAAPAYPAPSAAPAYPPPPAYPSGAPAARVEYATRVRPESAPARSATSRRRLPLWVWIVASVFLFAALLAQAAYFLRDPLASRYPDARPALAQACDVVGCTLALPRDLALLRIVGSDLQTEASGRLKLTLTLGNRAGHAQAWPVLVLTLMDQRNRPLARRSFAPSEYLGDATRIAAGIPPRSEQGLSLPLNVRNLSPMGYDLRLTF